MQIRSYSLLESKWLPLKTGLYCLVNPQFVIGIYFNPLHETIMPLQKVMYEHVTTKSKKSKSSPQDCVKMSQSVQSKHSCRERTDSSDQTFMSLVVVFLFWGQFYTWGADARSYGQRSPEGEVEEICMRPLVIHRIDPFSYPVWSDR